MARQRKIDPGTGLSREALETLLDLVEIRLGCVEVVDRDDVRELRQLEKTRDQLNRILGLKAQAAVSATPAFVRLRASA
ncbi:MAG: hypothetical protein KDC18_07635 [Alphaproteobacteria bacterium]|nr:hypothetical protein [Alphaproteobacteria bacterium]MCB9928000.1 hypothetical protein [Alphaproteobacteria bacterium]